MPAGAVCGLWRRCGRRFAGESPATTRALQRALPGLDMFAGVWQAGGMKKQLADQSFHDRKHQERKRAEAARKPVKNKVADEKSKVDQRPSE
jgi:hypothetical protein